MTAKIIKNNKCNEFEHATIPLQPMSTSIPSTCTNGHTTFRSPNLTKETVHYDPEINLIERIMHPVNKGHLRAYTNKMLHQICVQYRISPQNSIVQSLLHATASETIPHTALIALFFLLLNIDLALKDAMMQKEQEQTKAKLCKFCFTLRNHLITNFLVEETQQIQEFVSKCQEAWRNS